jgi:hypothetical protein
MLDHIIYFPGLDGSVFTELLDPDLGVKLCLVVLWIRIGLNTDPDPEFHFNKDPFPDLGI